MRQFVVRSALAAMVFGWIAVAPVMAAAPVGWRMDGTGRYPEATPPTEWSNKKNVVWKTEMPGRSFGSPILVDDKIFVVSDPSELLCLRASDGEILWRASSSVADAIGESKAEQVAAAWKKLEDEKNRLHKIYREFRKANPDAKEKLDELKKQAQVVEGQLGEFASKNPVLRKRGAGNSAGTPVCDGELVYTVYGTGIVSAHTLDGKRSWIKFVETSPLGFGHSNSPVLAGNKLIVNIKNLNALNAATGEIEWQKPIRARYATPILVRLANEDVLITPSNAIVRVSDGATLATDRALGSSEASPIVDGHIIYAQTRQTTAIRLPSIVGERIELKQLWQGTASRGRRTPSPVLHDGLIYGANTDGILDVTDAKTGATVYRKRLDIGRVYASVTVAGNLVYIGSTNGKTVVLATGREYKEVARNQMEGYGSCPVFAGKRMYVRAQKHLYCIGE